MNRLASIQGTTWLMVPIIAFFLALGYFISSEALGFQLLTTDVDTGTTSSASGLEFNTSNGIQELTMLRGCADGEVTKFNDSTGVWECAQDATASVTGAGADVLDLSDDGSDESPDFNELATTSGCSSADGTFVETITEPAADKVLFTCNQPDFADLSGTATDAQVPNDITIDNAATADALAADPSDCAANTKADAIAASGNLTCTAVDTGDITDGTILPADLDDGADTPADEECLTYEGTGPVFEWQTCATASGDSIQVEDGDDAGTFTAIDTTANFDDGGDINFNFSDGGAGGPDSITGTIRADSVALGTDTTGGYAGSSTEGGPATTASALDADPANCSAGNGAGGIAASGAAEDCTDYEEDLLDSDGLAAALNDENGTGDAVFDTDPILGGTVQVTGSGSQFILNLDCSGNANGGTLSVTGSGVVHCQDDDSTAGGGNSFDTIDVPVGTDPTASGAETLTITTPRGTMAITGVATDTIQFDVLDSPAINGTTVNGQAIDDELLMGSAAGQAGWISVPDCDSTLDHEVIHYTAPTNTLTCATLPITNSFETWDVPVGTDPVADAETDTITLTSPQGTLSITGVATDTVQWDLNPSGLDGANWGSGGGVFTWLFNVGGSNNPILQFIDGVIRMATSLLLDNESELRWGENDANGSNYIGVKAPAAVTNNQTCTLEDDGTPFDSCVTANPADQNLFETFNTPLGTDPVADTTTDTLNWDSPQGTMAITGDSTTDTISLDALDVSCTGCIGTMEAAGLDISEDTNLAGGRSITLSGDSIEADAELFTLKKSINVVSPLTGSLTNLVQFEYATAATITEVSCSTDRGTVVIQFDERARATPNTAGTDVLSATLTCDSDSQTTTSFSNAGIAADVPVNLQLSSGGGSPNIVRIHVEATKDD